jgi:hypothetical protein
MKTIFRVSVFGLVMTAFMAVSAISTFAQTPCEDTYEVKTGRWTKFKADLAKYDVLPKETTRDQRIDVLKALITDGEDYVSKYKDCDDTKQVVEKYYNKKLPAIKTVVETQLRYKKFEESVPAKNYADTFSAGKEIMATEPDSPLSLDVAIVLAAVGSENVDATPPVNTYNADALSAAKTAIQKIESGKTSTKYGLFNRYAYNTKDNVLGYLNYFVGNIMYFGQNSKKDALPYFYKASQANSDTKNKPIIYQAVGAWYLEEILKMNTDREAKLAANGGKENEETLAVLGMQKGYADRAIDAYGRAHKLALATDTEYKKSLYERLQGLYKLRFNKADGLDAYIASVTSKPMPDPTSEVTPVKEELPVAPTTTTSTTTTPTTTPATTTTTNPSNTTTKPATDTTKPSTTTKPANTTKPTTSKTSTTTKSTDTKTAVTKKKGAR